MAESKTRNYAFIVYPDSAPKNWIEILKSLAIAMFISPLHSPVINTNDEHERKKHYHVVIMFDGPKTITQALKISELVNGSHAIRLESLRGYARYICHLDNPEKEQFPDYLNNVISLAGADYYDVISLVTDKYIVLEEIRGFIEKYDIYSFYLLAKYAAQYKESWNRILTDKSTLYIKNYLSSRAWSKDTGQDHIIDPSSGEIIL